MKNFYSCVDTLIPSPIIGTLAKKAEKEGGLITAYASEEFRTVKSQPWIFIKLKETPGLDGVVFFTSLNPLRYSYKAIHKLVDKEIN